MLNLKKNVQWAHSTHSGIYWKCFVLFSFPKLFIYTIPFNSSVWFPLKQRFILFYVISFSLFVCAFFLSFSLFYFNLIEISFVSDYFQSFSRSFIRFCWFFIAYSALFAYLSFIRLQYSYVKTKKKSKSFENCCSLFLTYRSWSATQILHTLQMDVP